MADRARALFRCVICWAQTRYHSRQSAIGESFEGLDSPQADGIVRTKGVLSKTEHSPKSSMPELWNFDGAQDIEHV
jgi:hypothetical protein